MANEDITGSSSPLRLEVNHADGSKGRIIGFRYNNHICNGFIIKFYGEREFQFPENTELLFVEDFPLQLVLEFLSDPNNKKKRLKGWILEQQQAISEKKEYEEQVRRNSESMRTEKLTNIRSQFNNNFLGIDAFFQSTCTEWVSEAEFEQEKVSFVQSWFSHNVLSAKNREKTLPDHEQASAIGAVDNYIQVVARAGSGKTTTLVNRALFLIKHCSVSPDQIMILAFNRTAAMEIRKRLLILLCDEAEVAITAGITRRKNHTKPSKRIEWGNFESDTIDEVASNLHIKLPYVMTFHALAYAIVHPEESLLFNASDGSSESLNKVVQQVIDDHLRSPRFRGDIRNLMLNHFKADWERIITGGYNLDIADLLPFRRSLARETLRGEPVKSYGEKLIADFLFEHDIAYKYESNHWWNNINYRPDFTIYTKKQNNKSAGIIIEYFGLAGDVDYDEMTENKRAYWANKPDWLFLEFTPRDTAGGDADIFHARIKDKLVAAGVSCVRLSDDEIWARIKDRAIDRFTKVINAMINRCRQLSLSYAGLNQLIANYTPLSAIETQLLSILQPLYKAYLERLLNSGEEDFNGLMQRAADEISNGRTTFERVSGNGSLTSLRYLCIDEFQDFSELFYLLLDAIRKQNPSIKLFCVGDDWQAINGFAGSDLRYFEAFSTHIGEARRLYISTNYRSSKLIVDIGNALMVGLGNPAKAYKTASGEVVLVDINSFTPTLREKELHKGGNDIITPVVLRLISKGLADGLDVILLSRTGYLPWYINYDNGGKLEQFLEHIRSYFPKGLKERITIATCYRYKGLEKPFVIVLDADSQRYPMIHGDWVFTRIMGNSPEKITKEERRLFYVALTRAAKKLIIITDGKNRSPFLDDIKRNHFSWLDIDWQQYPPVADPSSERMIVKVGNQSFHNSKPTLAIKDQLKASGYQWQSVGWKSWGKSFPIDGFNVETIKNEVWSKLADGIEVRIVNDVDELIDSFSINNGQWHVR